MLNNKGKAFFITTNTLHARETYTFSILQDSFKINTTCKGTFCAGPIILNKNLLSKKHQTHLPLGSQ